MKTTVLYNEQITLPARLLKQDRILPGQLFEIDRIARGRYLLKKVDAKGGMISLIGCSLVPKKIGSLQSLRTEPQIVTTRTEA